MTTRKQDSTQTRNKTRKQALPNTVELLSAFSSKTFKTNRRPVRFIKRRIENLLFWVQVEGLRSRAKEGIMGSCGTLVWDELSEGAEPRGKQYIRLEILYKQYKDGFDWTVELSSNFVAKVLERTGSQPSCLDPVVAEYRFCQADKPTSLGRTIIRD